MIRPVLALLSAAALCGCSSIPNPFASKPDPKTIPAELVTIAHPSAALRTLWQNGIGAAGGYVFSPAIVDNSVYAAAQDGSLARYDGGRQVWRIDLLGRPAIREGPRLKGERPIDEHRKRLRRPLVDSKQWSGGELINAQI